MAATSPSGDGGETPPSHDKARTRGEPPQHAQAGQPNENADVTDGLKLKVFAAIWASAGVIGLLLITGFRASGKSFDDRIGHTGLDVLTSLSIVAIEIGILGLAFEWATEKDRRRTTARVTQELLKNELEPVMTEHRQQIAELTRTFNESVARATEETASLMLGDERFVQGLRQESRQRYLEAFMIANLDRDAQDLVKRTARELSGQTHYAKYDAVFKPVDKPELLHEGGLPFLILERTYYTNSVPSALRYRFETRLERYLQPPPPPEDEETFRWLLIADNPNQHDVLRNQFKIESIKINEYEQIRDGSNENPEDKTHDDESWVTQYTVKIDEEEKRPRPDGLSQDRVFVRLILPGVRPNITYSVLSGSLTKQFSVSCDYSRSKYVPEAFESIRTGSVRIDREPEGEPKTILNVYTDDWVLPSATAGFVFHERGDGLRPDGGASHA